MSDVYVDVAHASGVMRAAREEAQSRVDSHQADVPVFPACAAGRGFSGHAQRLQAAFDRVHVRGTARLHGVAATAQAAIDQFAAVDTADAASAGRITGVGEAL